MPTYDFRCETCDAQFEARAEPGGTVPCTACGSEDVRRLWSAPALGLGPGLRGHAARKSNALRAEREARRRGETN